MIKKQFIAGAICPACKKMDTVRTWNAGGVDKMECVSCQFRDEIRPPPSAAMAPTSTDAVANNEIGKDVQVLQFPNK